MSDSTTLDSAQERWRPLWVRSLQLFALCGFAVAQPMLDVLGGNPTFFVAHGAGRGTVVLFALALIVTPPLFLAFVELVVGGISSRAALFLHVAFVGLLSALTVTPPITRGLSAGVVIYAVVFVASAAIAAACFARLRLVGRYLAVLGLAPLLFVVLFLFTSPAKALIDDPPQAAGTRTSSSTPVVLLAMDEFAQGTILEPNGTIDSERFPNFGRLAKSSTWYPNATTNANVTEQAFPIMLTGRLPRTRGLTHPPIGSVFPNNIFSLLEGSHDFVVDEWVTAMCPVGRCPSTLDSYQSPKHLGADAALVLANVVLPDRVTAILPPLGNRWAGYFASPADAADRADQFPRIVRPIARALLDWLADDDFGSPEINRFEAFIAALRPSTRPTFAFLHLALPHQPWHLLPDTKVYDRHDTPGLIRNQARWTSEDRADAGLQRYMLQLKATDRLVGKLMAHLREQRMWDSALVLVVADHGVVFAKGRSMRSIDGIEGATLSIPMFVKYPHQGRGRVDRRNAELIDVLPTIADAAGVAVPWEVDGSSLAGRDPKRPGKRVWAWGEPLPPYPPSIADQRTLYAERIRRLFGSRVTRNDLFGFGPHRALVGRRMDDLDAAPPRTSGHVVLDDAERWANLDPEAAYIAARPTGVLQTMDPPPWIAVAVNGVVAGIGQPWTSGTEVRFDIVIDDTFLEEGRNDLTFLAVDDEGRMRRIPNR